MTDRTIRTTADLDGVRFDPATGLVPAVVQDAETGEVRMFAFQNREAVERTLDTGLVHFWSRSRGQLWMKGETSGNTLALVSLHTDCDGDALLARATPKGPTCHTGERSCFGETGAGRADVLERLDGTLAARAAERPEGSYTVRLLDDPNLRMKKIGEEGAELVAALATGDTGRAVEEAADLLYHVLVALRAEGVGLGAVTAELEDRAG